MIVYYLLLLHVQLLTALLLMFEYLQRCVSLRRALLVLANVITCGLFIGLILFSVLHNKVTGLAITGVLLLVLAYQFLFWFLCFGKKVVNMLAPLLVAWFCASLITTLWYLILRWYVQCVHGNC